MHPTIEKEVTFHDRESIGPRTPARVAKRTRPTPEDIIAEAAEGLLHEFDSRVPVHLVGVAAFELREGDDAGGVRQLDLFDAPRGERDERLDRTLDVVHRRFGDGAVTRARHLARHSDRGSHPTR